MSHHPARLEEKLLGLVVIEPVHFLGRKLAVTQVHDHICPKHILPVLLHYLRLAPMVDVTIAARDVAQLE